MCLSGKTDWGTGGPDEICGRELIAKGLLQTGAYDF